MLREADSYPGPSLVIAYSPCIAHGYEFSQSLEQQKAAVHPGHWPLFRYDPRLEAAGKSPLQLDSKAPSIPLAKYTGGESRYTMLVKSQPEVAQKLPELAEGDVAKRWRLYEMLAASPTLPEAGSHISRPSVGLIASHCAGSGCPRSSCVAPPKATSSVPPPLTQDCTTANVSLRRWWSLV